MKETPRTTAVRPSGIVVPLHSARIAGAIRFDVMFQFRHGFYGAYLVICAAYIGLLRALPPAIREIAVPLVLFTDPAFIGFFFIGGIVLLEKDQRTLEGLFVTPCSVAEYALARTISFSILSTATGMLIAAASGLPFRPLLLLPALAIGSPIFTMAGLSLASRVKSINGFMLAAPVFIVILMLPLLSFFDLFHSPLFWLVPSWPVILLADGAVRGIPAVTAVGAAAALLFWAALAFLWGNRWFERYVVRRIGGGE